MHSETKPTLLTDTLLPHSCNIGTAFTEMRKDSFYGNAASDDAAGEDAASSASSAEESSDDDDDDDDQNENDKAGVIDAAGAAEVY